MVCLRPTRLLTSRTQAVDHVLYQLRLQYVGPVLVRRVRELDRGKLQPARVWRQQRAKRRRGVAKCKVAPASCGASGDAVQEWMK